MSTKQTQALVKAQKNGLVTKDPTNPIVDAKVVKELIEVARFLAIIVNRAYNGWGNYLSLIDDFIVAMEGLQDIPAEYNGITPTGFVLVYEEVETTLDFTKGDMSEEDEKLAERVTFAALFLGLGLTKSGSADVDAIVQVMIQEGLIAQDALVNPTYAMKETTDVAVFFCAVANYLYAGKGNVLGLLGPAAAAVTGFSKIKSEITSISEPAILQLHRTIAEKLVFQEKQRNVELMAERITLAVLFVALAVIDYNTEDSIATPGSTNELNAAANADNMIA